MEDKITIIEGPPPTFEAVDDGWSSGLNESPNLAHIAVTRLRTFNGPALVERCNRAWRHKLDMRLEFRATDGLERNASIVAARSMDTDDGQVLILWVRLPDDEVKIELGYDDTFDDENDDDIDLIDPF